MARNEIKNVLEIPNVGKATEKDFILLGINDLFESLGDLFPAACGVMYYG